MLGIDFHTIFGEPSALYWQIISSEPESLCSLTLYFKM